MSLHWTLNGQSSGVALKSPSENTVMGAFVYESEGIELWVGFWIVTRLGIVHGLVKVQVKVLVCSKAGTNGS